MTEEQYPHKLTLNQRKNLTMTGVTEVVRFEDTAVVLHTTLGTLVIQGQELKLKTLSLEGGQVAVEGEISVFSTKNSVRAASGSGFWDDTTDSRIPFWHQPASWGLSW